MSIRWFMRRWEETRGDEFAGWGAATYYFETRHDGWPLRQIEVYDDGHILRYGLDHAEDEFGGLGQGQLDESEDWSKWAISEREFEDVWGAAPQPPPGERPA